MVAKLVLVVAMTATFVLTLETFNSDEYFLGPDEGCMNDKDVDDVTFRCALTDNKVSVSISTNGLNIKMECQKTSKIACTEFDIVKKQIYDYFGNWTLEANRKLQLMEVDRCDVGAGSIKCLLDLVDADDTNILYLRHSSLLPENLEGIKLVKKLRMFNAEPSSVPFKALSLLPNLESFTMRESKIVLQSEQDLLPNLLILELAQSEIKSLPKAAFKNTPNIQSLLLWDNKIEYVDFDAFEGLTNLVNVSLTQNLITQLPGGLFRHTPYVERILLHANKLNELTEDVFSGLQELKEITLFDNKVPLILKNRTFSNLPSLRSLDLHGSNIRNLTDDLFYNTTNLKMLLLNGNKLKNIPSKVFTKINLSVLHLNKNILEDLPPEVFNFLDSLETLSLHTNLLKSLPAGIFSKLNSLTKLELRANKLTSLEKDVFKGLNSLKELFLDDNEIKTIDESAFKPLTELEVLSLSGNRITISEDSKRLLLPPNNESFCLSPMSSLNKLRILNLSRNNLTVICKDWTDFIFTLKELDLSNNKFTHLTAEDMKFSSSVTVNLQNNKIQNIEPYVDTINTAPPKFLLNGNPYRCDCKLYNFTQMYKDPKVKKILALDRAVCAQPRALKGRKLTDLKADTLICESDCSNSTQNLQNISRDFQICSSCIERPSQSLLEMSCRSFPKTYPELKYGLKSISIKLEHFSNIPELPQKVQLIDLSNLNLTKPPLPYYFGFNITTLNLTNNYLTRAPKELLQSDYVLYLKGNRFECTCETKSDLALLKEYQYNIKDYGKLICDDDNLLISKDIDQLCTARDISILLGIIAIVVLTIALFAFMWYKYNTEIRIILRKYNLLFEKLNPDIKFDAYFTFAPEDEDRLRTKEIPALEGGKPPLRLYLHYKHFRLGGYIPDEIAQAVEDSHWTIIALSNKYLESNWNSLELKLAHNKEKIIFLLLEDISQMDLDQKTKKLLSLYPIYNAKDQLACERIRDKILRSVKNIKNDKSTNKALDVHVNENGQLEIRVPKAL